MSCKNRLPGDEEQTLGAVTPDGFSGRVVHDLNNLMSVILCAVESLRLEEGPPASIAEDLQVIRDAAQRAQALNNQLLAMCRPATRPDEVLDCYSLLPELEPRLRRLVGPDIELRCVVPEGLWLVAMEPLQVERILVNLAANARDAMPQGGELTITAHNTVRRGREQGRAYVVLEVSDTGEGMYPAVRARIFEPFFTTKHVGCGAGLGLATVHDIAMRHGGFVAVESSPGQGSTFRVFLPQAESPA